MTEEESYNIPNNIFFIWFGNDLPWTAKLSILSAIDKGKPDKVQLIQSRTSGKEEELLSFFDYPGFEILEAGSHWFEGDGMQTAKDLYQELTTPAARSNLLRLAVLYKQGGIYLDTDTITVKSFESLNHYSGYCGLETLALPASLFHSINPLAWSKAGLLLTLREACTRIPQGYRTFRRIERYYTQSTNNAVMGSVAKNPFIAEAFKRISELEEIDRVKRFRLGTHLLQTLSANRSSPNMEVLPADYFYPLAPELSVHLFKKGSAAYIDELLGSSTVTIHWYRSIYSRRYPGEISLKELRDNNTAFAKLAEPYYEKLSA